MQSNLIGGFNEKFIPPRTIDNVIIFKVNYDQKKFFLIQMLQMLQKNFKQFSYPLFCTLPIPKIYIKKDTNLMKTGSFIFIE